MKRSKNHTRSVFHEKTAQNLLKIYYSGPTDDNGAPSPGDLARGVDFIAGEIDGGGKVFIH
jgi:protein-tyrosine phosphatase